MEFLQCPNCSDIYGINEDHIKAPKILKECGDYICKECLDEILKKEESEYFQCHRCNHQIKKYQNIQDYTTNNDLIRIINSTFNIKDSKEEDKKGDKNEPILLKIITLGSSGVGKTSIFKRLLFDKYDEYYQTTIGIQSLIYYIIYDLKKYKLSLWDTGGQENFNALTKNYLRNADGVIFVFDLSNEESFDDLENWYELYKNEKGEEKINGVILGNKSDLIRQVDYEDAEKYAKEKYLKYFETSAKLDKSIKKSIISLLEVIIKSKINYRDPNSIREMFLQSRAKI